MVRNALADYQKSLAFIRRFLGRAGVEDSLLTLTDPTPGLQYAQTVNVLRQAMSPAELRQSRYSFVITTLYSSFERFTDALIVNFVLQLENTIEEFGDLPEKIRLTHEGRTIEALNDTVWMGRTGTQSSSLIESLYKCAATPADYRLNGAVYSRHGFNYRIESLNRSFVDLGIPELVATAAGNEAFSRYRPQPGLEGLVDHECGAIDDLAVRRNDVAHGEANDLLSLDYLSEYVLFFWYFGLSVYDLLRQYISAHVIARQGTRLMNVDQVHHGNVVLSDLSYLPGGTEITIGTPVLMPATNPPCERSQLGFVREIQVNDVPVDRIEAAEGLKIGLRLSFKPVVARPLYLCMTNDHTAWIVEDCSELNV